MVFSRKTSEEVTHGGKIIMPPSALEQLARLNISYPMLFKLTSGRSASTHCGVLEFVAEEGRIYVPHWIMNQLCIQDGDLVVVESASLKLATFSKFQPQTVDFLDITNPKAVLESKLRSFACLTKGDIIGIEYNQKIYELLVVDTKPDGAVSIIECDMKVDFAAPVGYQSPEPQPMSTEDLDGKEERDSLIQEVIEKNGGFKAFSGDGQRLDGKEKKNATRVSEPQQHTKRERGVPNYNYQKGRLSFARAKDLRPEPEEPMDGVDLGFEAFSGEGQRLRIKKNKNKIK